MIGRDREMADLIERIGRRRLVTVIGAGGIGKTTVARAVAEAVADRFALGAHFVDLTAVDRADDVGGAIAAQLGYPSFRALLDSPTDAEALVVVDNCEHVIDAAASAIADVLASCPSPTVLATSRSPLDLVGESVMVLGPLGVPASSSAVGTGTESVRLFLQCARDSGAVPGDDQLHDIAELCRHLDGVPLAIELAAAQTRAMTPAGILGHLRSGDDVLARPRLRSAGRHRSLWETIEWSRLLLEPEPAALFDRLGVFAGPFSIPAAHAICAPPNTSPSATRLAVTSLVDSSLLAVEHREAEARYRMLTPIRSFALGRLGASGDLPAVQDRFVDHVVDVVTTVVDATRLRWSTPDVQRLLALYDNMAAALRWCIYHDDTVDRAGIIYGALWAWVPHGHTDDIALLGRELVARWPDLPPPWGPDVAATRAAAEYLLGRPRVAATLAEGALPEADRSRFAPATLRRILGEVARVTGDASGAEALFAEAAHQADRLGLRSLAMEAEVLRAQVLADTGRIEEARAITRAVYHEAVSTGSDLSALWAWSSEGHTLLRRDPQEALPVIEEALVAARRADHAVMIAANLYSKTVALATLGHTTEAAAAALELIDALLYRGVLSSGRTVLDVVALVLRRAGDPRWAPIHATARTLPVTVLMAGVGYELFTLPDSDGQPMERRLAISLARRALTEILADPPTGGGEPSAGADAVFSRSGDVWDVRFAGTAVHLKASKGMDDLARLLASPGVEVHCLELSGAGLVSSSTGETIDSAARRSYEARVRELQGDVEEAEADNDTGRAEQARSELDALVDHLAGALGLGGRARQSGGSAERARSAVTHRLRSTIRRIADQHPELGRHLAASVVTGSYCCYRPERPVEWRVTAP